MNILVTGGLGYIGSHICVDLLKNNFNVIIVDFSKDFKTLDRIEELSNKLVSAYYPIDICDKKGLNQIFELYDISCVIHLAGYKSIPESLEDPLKYFSNNLIGTITLLEVMNKYNCKKIIFSSSASVYSEDNPIPITEESLIDANNPYSFTKLTIENMLKEIYQSDNSWQIIILRYFNPIGSILPYNLDDTGLMSAIIKSLRSNETLKIYGKNYDTPDGTAIRDFIHILDLSSSHLAALNKIKENSLKIYNVKENLLGLFEIYNVGTGKGTTVLQLIKIIQDLTGKKIRYEFDNNRPGDKPKIYTSIDKIKVGLNWKPQYDLKDISIQIK